jgi:hypothetical protein
VFLGDASPSSSSTSSSEVVGVQVLFLALGPAPDVSAGEDLCEMVDRV